MKDPETVPKETASKESKEKVPYREKIATKVGYREKMAMKVTKRETMQKRKK
jgi:hypothetical protein